MKRSNNKLYFFLISILLLLLLPFIAMQFTTEVNWSLYDFVAAGTLLLCFAMGIEFVIRKVKNTKYRLLICLVCFILFALIWAELAVGIFGSAIAGS